MKALVRLFVLEPNLEEATLSLSRDGRWRVMLTLFRNRILITHCPSADTPAAAIRLAAKHLIRCH